jgi:hypothetical protein
MSSEKSTLKRCVAHSYYDLGEIRTESAIRLTPPEKKERLEQEAVKLKAPRKFQGADLKSKCYKIFLYADLVQANF